MYLIHHLIIDNCKNINTNVPNNTATFNLNKLRYTFNDKEKLFICQINGDNNNITSVSENPDEMDVLLKNVTINHTHLHHSLSGCQLNYVS